MEVRIEVRTTVLRIVARMMALPNVTAKYARSTMIDTVRLAVPELAEADWHCPKGKLNGFMVILGHGVH